MSSHPNIEMERWERHSLFKNSGGWSKPSYLHNFVSLGIHFQGSFQKSVYLRTSCSSHKFGCQNGRATGLQAYLGADGNIYCCVQISWWAYLSDMFLSYDKKPTISLYSPLNRGFHHRGILSSNDNPFCRACLPVKNK